jgi:hypothetical protein
MIELEDFLKSSQNITDRINKKNVVVSMTLEIISSYRRIYELMKERFPNKKYPENLDELFAITLFIKGCLYGYPNPYSMLERVLVPRTIIVAYEIDKISGKYYEKIFKKLMENLKKSDNPITTKEIYLDIYLILVYLILFYIEKLFVDYIETNPKIKEDEEIRAKLKEIIKFKYLAGEIIKIFIIDILKYGVKS